MGVLGVREGSIRISGCLYELDRQATCNSAIEQTKTSK